MSVSQHVLDRTRSAEEVRSALAVFRARILVGTREIYGPAASGAVAVLLDAMLARLDDADARMLAAGRALSDERADDDQKRARRNEAQAALRAQLIQIRKMIEGLYGKDAARQLGFVGRLPKAPHHLRAYAETVLRRLLEMPPPAPVAGLASFQATAFVAPLRACLEELSTAIDDVVPELPEADAAFVTKEAAVQAFDQVFRPTADLASALLAAIGERELASKVHPSGPQRIRPRRRAKAKAQRKLEPA